EMKEFCGEHSIPHEVCGKLVVATDPAELSRIQALFERGQQNGLQGLCMLAPEELREIEPHAAGLAAIRVPEEGIADYPRVCDALAGEIVKQGVELLTSAGVSAIQKEGAGWRVIHAKG